jgi:hypothetical protein
MNNNKTDNYLKCIVLKRVSPGVKDPWIGSHKRIADNSCTSTAKNLTKTPGILHFTIGLPSLPTVRPTELGGSTKTPGIYPVQDPAIDGGAAVNELPMHNTALFFRCWLKTSFCDKTTILYCSTFCVHFVYILCTFWWILTQLEKLPNNIYG